MQIPSITTLAGLLAIQSTLVAAGHQARHEALHAIERRHRHHSRNAHSSRAELSPVPVALLTRDAQVTPSGLVNKRSYSDVPGISKRSTCQFPSDAGLVAVTPGSQNGGWAIPPDTSCNGGMYCPYACPSGQVMAQWDPAATSYTYPISMNGGLKCNSDGTVSKPFPDKPYCVDATGLANAVDNTGKGVSFCQTQLPGDESMVIPTFVQGQADLAIPGPSYWVKTAAHYYINPPGVGTSDGCQWGTNQNPHGNWAPYVAGGNQVDGGETFLKLGWNPIYLEPTTPFRNDMPNWGVEVHCDGDGCNGLPCAIDPAKNKVNEMVGGQGDGAGGANFCVVTAPKGVKVSFVVFESGQSSDPNANAPAPSPSSAAPSPSPTPTTSDTPSSTPAAVTSDAPSSTDDSSSVSATPTYSYAPHEFIVNVNASNSTVDASGSSVSLPVAADATGAAGAAGASAQTSAIAAATASPGAATANIASSGLAFAAGLAAILAF